MLWPVFELRPLPGIFRGPPLRFAGGKWIEDDGKHDLAFIGTSQVGGAPICLYFEPPYQRNIVWSWVDGHWSDSEHRHPNSNPWHYALRAGETQWGGEWRRDQHPNYKAGRDGMTKMASMRGCSNGRPIEMMAPGKHIAAGLVRDWLTGAVLTIPREPKCMFCGDVWHPKCEAVSA